MPACALYYKTTFLDLVLPRMLAGRGLTRAEAAHMGEGRLLPVVPYLYLSQVLVWQITNPAFCVLIICTVSMAPISVGAFIFLWIIFCVDRSDFLRKNV